MDKVVHVLVTGADVIHSWTVPAFGVKIDAVPGRLNETWFRAEQEGVYFGQCSELCGKNHSYMPITVKVVSQEAYDTWLDWAIDEYGGTARAEAPAAGAAAAGPPPSARRGRRRPPAEPPRRRACRDRSRRDRGACRHGSPLRRRPPPRSRRGRGPAATEAPADARRRPRRPRLRTTAPAEPAGRQTEGSMTEPAGAAPPRHARRSSATMSSS